MKNFEDEISDFDTLAIHADRLDGETSVTPAIYQTATFKSETSERFAENANQVRPEEFYTRYGNPTRARAEKIIAALEGAESAMLTSSGMAAISTCVLSLIEKGDHIIAQQNHYGGTIALIRDMLPRFGVEVTIVDQTQTGQFEKAVKKSTKLIIVESPSNPVMKLTDLRAVAEIAKQNNILTLIDNTFASPINQRPLEFGIDLVMHSATKYLGGHADVTAGVIAGSEKLINRIWDTYIILGTALSPFDSWLVARGLRTLSLRVEKQNRTALAVARFLEKHPKIERVFYPGLESHPQNDLAIRQMKGFSGILSFEIQGGIDEAERFISNLNLAVRAPSVGGVETLVVRPAEMLSHQVSQEEFENIGVKPNLIRLSVGIESEDDLIKDVEKALLVSVGKSVNSSVII